MSFDAATKEVAEADDAEARFSDFSRLIAENFDSITGATRI